MHANRRLFVDGFNVLHAWRRGAGAASHETAALRHELSDAVRVLSDGGSVEVTVVFDGPGLAGREEMTGPGGRGIFAPAGLAADGLIERLVAADAEPAACVVATADRLERETVLALGAECISPDELARWIDRCRRQTRQRLRKSGAFANKLPL